MSRFRLLLPVAVSIALWSSIPKAFMLIYGIHGLKPFVVAGFPTRKFRDRFHSCEQESVVSFRIPIKGCFAHSSILWAYISYTCLYQFAEQNQQLYVVVQADAEHGPPLSAEFFSPEFTECAAGDKNGSTQLGVIGYIADGSNREEGLSVVGEPHPS
ncbi:hypothetical protein OPV22_026934 [Ensete ventricosum]|uniref:Uncharacterized protein n=1 Tax=Ensete ventricosum TaxID=4639 RepID=A0AAV8P4W4_ENSVE|nr:hypothetical protein OPV22_026934 [Ensete ventricosum]